MAQAKTSAGSAASGISEPGEPPIDTQCKDNLPKYFYDQLSPHVSDDHSDTNTVKKGRLLVDSPFWPNTTMHEYNNLYTEWRWHLAASLGEDIAELDEVVPEGPQRRISALAFSP